MTRQETIESKLSINDRITPDDLRQLQYIYRNDSNVSRLIACLTAHMETPDVDDEEKDDLRIKAVMAEHETDRAVRMAMKLGRHIRNADKIEPLAWGVRGMQLLGELREFDRNAYDAEVKK